MENGSKYRDVVNGILVDTAYIGWEKTGPYWETMAVKVKVSKGNQKTDWLHPLTIVRAKTEAEALENHDRVLGDVYEGKL